MLGGVRALWVPFALAGCDWAYSLDRPPEQPTTVEVTYRRIALSNLADMPVRVPVAYPELAVRVELADGTVLEPIPDAEGKLSFQRFGEEPYRIRFTAPGEIPNEYLLATPTLDVGIKRTVRPDAVEPADTTRLVVDIPDADIVSDTATLLHATGVWAQRSSPGPSANRKFDLEWKREGGFLGLPGLLDASKGDRLFCSQHEVEASPTYVALSEVGEVANPTMADGETTTVTCTLQPVPRDKCLRLAVGHAAENVRLKAVSTSFVDTQTLTVVLAAPDPVHSPAGHWLANQYVSAMGDAGALDFRGDVQFAQPFPNHRVVVEARTSRTRALSLPGTGKDLAFGLSMSRFFVVDPEDGPCTQTADTSAQIAIPSSPDIAGTGLVADETPVTIDREKRVPITWSLGPGGTTDRFVVRLFEVQIVNMIPIFVGVQQWVTTSTDRSIDIDPDVLVAGKRYSITVETNLGIPGAAEGNMVDFVYPLAIAGYPSPTFIVAN